MIFAALAFAVLTHAPVDGTFLYPTNRSIADTELSSSGVLGGCDFDDLPHRRVTKAHHTSVIGSADAWFDRFVLATLTGTGREADRSRRVTSSTFDSPALTNYISLSHPLALHLAVPSNRNFRANGPRWNRRPVAIQDTACWEYYQTLDLYDYSPQQFLSPWEDGASDEDIWWGSSALDGIDRLSHPQWTSDFWSMTRDWAKFYLPFWSLDPAVNDGRSWDITKLVKNSQYSDVVWIDGGDPKRDDMWDAFVGMSSTNNLDDAVAKATGNPKVKERIARYLGFGSPYMMPMHRLIWSQWSAINGTLALLDRVYVTQEYCPRINYTNETASGSRMSNFDIKVTIDPGEGFGPMDFSTAEIKITSERTETNAVTRSRAASRHIEERGELSYNTWCGFSAGNDYEYTAISNFDNIASVGTHQLELWLEEDPWDYEYMFRLNAFVDGSWDAILIDILPRVSFSTFIGAINLEVVAESTRTVAVADYDYATPGTTSASVPATYPHPAAMELLGRRNVQPEIYATTWEGKYVYSMQGENGNYVRMNTRGPLLSVSEYNTAIRSLCGSMVGELRGEVVADIGLDNDAATILQVNYEEVAKSAGIENLKSYLGSLGKQYADMGVRMDDKALLRILPDGKARIGYFDSEGSWVDVPIYISIGYAIQNIAFYPGFDSFSTTVKGGIMTTASVHWNFNTMKRKQ